MEGMRKEYTGEKGRRGEKGWRRSTGERREGE